LAPKFAPSIDTVASGSLIPSETAREIINWFGGFVPLVCAVASDPRNNENNAIPTPNVAFDIFMGRRVEAEDDCPGTARTVDT
jgi:hypothetical protein